MQRLVPIPDPYDLAATLSVLKHGGFDPTIRITEKFVWRAIRNAQGTATVRYARVDGGVEVTAWGDGAEQALDDSPSVLGTHDDPSELNPGSGLLRELARRFAGIRMPCTRSIFDPLVPAILEQKVTGAEATKSFEMLVRKHGEKAPGPPGLTVLPAPSVIAEIPYYTFHRYGVERRRSDVIRHACARANRLNEAIGMTAVDARARLQAIPGIGVWTAAEVTRISHGDPDAVSIGDYHVPNVVSWALAGEPRADDARMLELLEPFAGQRARVVRLLEASGITPPAFGPRHRLRSIAEI
ncbi:MAG: DNA-3-methyladenine glycosylase family protein [Actinomycetota bacterium]